MSALHLCFSAIVHQSLIDVESDLGPKMVEDRESGLTWPRVRVGNKQDSSITYHSVILYCTYVHTAETGWSFEIDSCPERPPEAG
jgi:hypothetical protein